MINFDLHYFLFQVFPYLALLVLFFGSLLRFDREPYTWRSKSSQILRSRGLILGSTLFHIGILFLLFGHLAGLFTPPVIYHALGISTAAKQTIAMVTGGIAGLAVWVGLAILLWRRLLDRRISANSSLMDVVVLALLFAEVNLGLLSLIPSSQHMDGSVMLQLTGWARGMAIFDPNAAEQIRDVHIIFKLHIVLGLMIFALSPFTRMVHVFSAPIFFVFRQWQIVRRREV